MKTTKRIAMCLVLMGLFTTMTGCEDLAPSGLVGALGDVFDTECTYGEGVYDVDEDWDTGSDSGTFFSDYGGSLSWW